MYNYKLMEQKKTLLQGAQQAIANRRVILLDEQFLGVFSILLQSVPPHGNNEPPLDGQLNVV